MDGSLVLVFWGVSMLFVLMPGVEWAYAISSGLRPGGALPAVSGMLSGHLVATLAVAVGVAGVLAASAPAMTGLTLAGAAYLLWLGVGALRHPASAPSSAPVVPASRGRLFTKGVGISLLNPKVFLLFLALLPQFTDPAAGWAVGAQMVVLGGLHVLNCALVYLVVGLGSAAVLTTRPTAAKVVNGLAGVLMVGLGGVLVIEQLLDLATRLR